VLLGQLDGYRSRFHRLTAVVDGEQNGVEHGLQGAFPV
jgi:hypothetical protein